MSDATTSELVHDEQWQRLDPRMLLVHPIRELLRFLPVLLGLFVAGTATGGNEPWQYLGVAIPVGLGLLRYLTTSFRIHAGRIELRRGLLNKHVLSTPLDRVRTIDLTASLIHRVLGLTTVRIGTGTASRSDDDQLDLDGLPLVRARELRRELLQRAQPDLVHAADGEGEAGLPATPPERVVVRLQPGWLVYAPFTTSGLVIAAGILGAGSQLLNLLDLWTKVGTATPDVGASPTWWLLGPVLVVLVVAAVSALAVVGYLATNWDFTLSHTRGDGSWHLRRGLLTTRETSIDDGRVRGVSMGSPLGLRLAGGRQLSAIVTGLDRSQQGSSVLVPPAPAAVVRRVADDVLGTRAPLTVPLVPHGPRARARRFSRALLPAAALSALLVVAVAAFDAPGWFVVAAVAAPLVALCLAQDRWRALGHALVDGWFVVRSGSLSQRHAVLATDGIIGWNFRDTWFQRRVGLTTLVATTAGGRQAYTALDVPEDVAVGLAGAAVPGLVEQFLA